MREVLLFTALVCVAPDRPDPTPKDTAPIVPFRAQLNGEWRVVQSLIAGRAHTSIKPNQAVFVFDGDKMMIRREDVGGKELPYTIVVNGKSNPATIDVSIGKTKSPKTFSAGIIKIEGDVLTMCLQSGVAANRPTEFASHQDSRTILWQLKRIKK